MDGEGGTLTIAQQATAAGRQGGRQHLSTHEGGQGVISAPAAGFSVANCLQVRGHSQQAVFLVSHPHPLFLELSFPRDILAPIIHLALGPSAPQTSDPKDAATVCSLSTHSAESFRTSRFSQGLPQYQLQLSLAGRPLTQLLPHSTLQITRHHLGHLGPHTTKIVSQVL